MEIVSEEQRKSCDVTLEQTGKDSTPEQPMDMLGEKEREEAEMDIELQKLEDELQRSGKKPFLAAKIVPKPSIFIWFLASFASMGGLLFGLDQSLISGAELYIPSDLHIDSSRMSMITGFMALGAIFGALSVYPVNELLGRRLTIIVACILYTAGAILEAAAGSFGTLLAGRMVLGAGVGLETGTVPPYISENCAKRWRGGLVSLYQVNIDLGLLFGYIAAAIFVDVSGNWRWMLGCSLLFSTILLIAMIFLPESTRWLMRKGRKLDSYMVWKYVRGLDALEEKEEFFRMETLVLEELEASKTRWILLDFIRRPRCRRAVVYAILLQLVVQQFSGINSVLYYMGPLMEKTGLSAQNAVYTSMIGGGTMFLSTIPAIYFMDRLGRRPVLLTLLPGVSVGLFIVGFSFLANNLKTQEAVYITGIVIYMFFWGSCLGPTPWVVASEIYPTYLRSTGVSINALCNWLGTFTTTYAFTNMLNGLTPTGTFVGLYNGVVIFGGIYLLFFMPETKNLTLEEMDQLFERPTKDIVHENWEKPNKYGVIWPTFVFEKFGSCHKIIIFQFVGMTCHAFEFCLLTQVKSRYYLLILCLPYISFCKDPISSIRILLEIVIHVNLQLNASKQNKFKYDMKVRLCCSKIIDELRRGAVF
eukprot:jgi/Galph1/5757/GphlegSOOS_G4381.1